MLTTFKNKLKRISGQSNEQRVILIHNHLFKNAGTTIDWALEKNFGKSFIDHRDDVSMRKGASYLGPYIDENRKIRALSTHHLTYPLPILPNTRLVNIMMFRHPIERVTSVYKFEKNYPEVLTLGVEKARQLNLRDYILWRMTPQAGATIRNFHIRKTLPPRKSNQEDINDQDFANSKQLVATIEMLGLVEKFDESMVLFEEFMKFQIHRSIDLAYIPQNIGQVEKGSSQSRLDRLKLEIGEDVYNLLIEKNKPDILLYEWVCEEFTKRTEAVPDFQAKLAKFKSRCPQNS